MTFSNIHATKNYLRDSGLLHYLLGISTQLELEMHPKLGSSWEGYAVEQIIDTVNPDQAYFWSTHSGAELNLLIITDFPHP